MALCCVGCVVVCLSLIVFLRQRFNSGDHQHGSPLNRHFGLARFCILVTILKQTVVAIKGCDSVSFGHRGIVEGRIDEILERIQWRRLLHDGLSDVDDLRGIGTKAVNPQYLERLAVEQDLSMPMARPVICARAKLLNCECPTS